MNEPPEAHQAAALKELAKIVPLDAEGKPSKNGKIVLLAIGMSNTTASFSKFKETADRDPQKSPALVIVDGAQGGQAAAEWASPDSKVWSVVEQRLKAAGVTSQQIQIAWIKQANKRPPDDFPGHAKKLHSDLVTDLNLAKAKYPNLRVTYLSSRIYGGYATTVLNPEPQAYEGAFAMRWLILDQIKGEAKLNYDAARGPAVSPLLLWGPYLWADGTTPRKSDGLIWVREDLQTDGTHPSGSGRQKVADMLLKFCKTDAGARGWFLKP
jgi:hypothetical protein